MSRRTQLRRQVLANLTDMKEKIIGHNVEAMRRDGISETAIQEFVQLCRERNAKYWREDVEDVLNQIGDDE
jgi:hypothetical protein